MFIFGTQYLRGETPAKKEWDKDLSRIKKCGFNTVRAWIVWNTVEKAENVIDYEYLHTFLDIAGRYELQVGLLFHLHGAPEWLIKKYPQYYYVNSDGFFFEPSLRPNTPSGGWPGLCYDYEEVQGIEERFISSVVKSLSNRKEIAFWEPMNEPHQWVDLAKNPVGIFCYCQATRRKFREWLKRKYGEIDTLNEAWGRHHNDWDEVRPPTWRFGYTDYIDFRLFTIDNVLDEITRRTNIIKKYDGRPVIAHSWGGGTITCPNIGAMAFDDWKNSTIFDKWGYSAFPDNYRHNVMLGLSTDATRSAGHGKEIWLSELGAGDRGSGLNRRGRVKPEVLSTWTWESIRHGVKGVLYWQYRKEAHGPEFGSPALTDYDGGTTENLEMVAKICDIIQKNDALFLSSQVEDAKIAIVFSMRSFLVDWCDHRNSHLSIDCTSGYYRMFWEENIPVDIVHEDFMELSKVQKYRLVILPQPSALSSNARKVLADYVENGGTILSDPYFCPYDVAFHLADKVPGSGYDSIFGCLEKDIYSAKGNNVKVTYKNKVYSISNSHFKECFKVTTGTPLGYYVDDSTPCIVFNIFGKGKAVISGLNLGLSYSPKLGVGDDFVRNDEEEVFLGAKEIVLDIAREQGVENSIKTESSRIQGSFLINEKDDDILILINNSEEMHESPVHISSRYIKYINLMDGCSGDIKEGKANFCFNPLEVKVLRVKKARV
ncbi:MAG: beta-galactosidase [Firmicutes bacterium]|nr:beta-galactosidase [Bacillota bacterium]